MGHRVGSGEHAAVVVDEGESEPPDSEGAHDVGAAVARFYARMAAAWRYSKEESLLALQLRAAEYGVDAESIVLAEDEAWDHLGRARELLDACSDDGEVMRSGLRAAFDLTKRRRLAKPGDDSEV